MWNKLIDCTEKERPLLFVRNALTGPAPWITILAAGIVVPILAITVLFVRDIDRLTTAAKTERAGIAHLRALDDVFRAAWQFRLPSDCEREPGEKTRINEKIATLTRLERDRPFIGRDWDDAVSTWWSNGSATVLADKLVDALSPFFVRIADSSGVTYDPEVAGIDLADALAYRLPRAADDVQRVALGLCPRAVPQPLLLAGMSGGARTLLKDAFDDVHEAVQLDRTLPPSVQRSERTAVRATDFALARVDRFAAHPGTTRERAAAARADANAVQAIYVLMDTIAPALDHIAARRIDTLQRRYYLTLVPGVLAMVAAALFVLLGARSVLQRAELAQMRRTAAELEYHATHDTLTNLPNRAAFATALQATISAATKSDGAATVLFIDLDDFKLVNDSLGHAAGDLVLCTIADRLKRICEDFGGVTVARFGGDEFAMLIADHSESGAARRSDDVVERIRADVVEPVPLGPAFDGQVVVSASVGLASLGRTGSGDARASDLLRDADVAMYEAKAHGKARAATFGPAMRERAVRRLRLTNDLRGAAERDEFVLAYEPIVNLVDGSLAGCEALIRWHHPRLGPLLPGAFLAVAEESGMIVQIGRWVLGTAVEGLARDGVGFVHVNLAVADLAEETLLRTVSTLLDRHTIEPDLLAIEVTERSIVRSGGGAEETLKRLRSLGVRIWIDDFGVEYSSLRYLDRLPVDGVKIDRSFVSGDDGQLASPSIVKTILELADSFGLAVIAEGIETQQQRDALLQLGCRQGQGNLYTRGVAHRGAPSISTVATAGSRATML